MRMGLSRTTEHRLIRRKFTVADARRVFRCGGTITPRSEHWLTWGALPSYLEHDAMEGKDACRSQALVMEDPLAVAEEDRSHMNPALRLVRPLKDLVSKHRQSCIVLLVACTTGFMAVRLAWLVNRYAVDLLYWDEWDLWEGLFHKADVWTLWRLQWGPQRQGLAQWIIAIVAWLSDWNVRAEAFATVFIVLLAVGVGLVMARTLRGRWSLGDCLIPVALLSVSLVAVATVAPNLSHGPLPLLLVMVCAYFAQAKNERTRVIGIAVSLAIGIQTGFTWFLAIVVVPLLLVLLLAAIRSGRPARYHVLGLVLVVASLAVFFYGFVFEPAVACFRFPDPKPWRYLGFMGVMVQRVTEFTSKGGRPLGILGVLLGLGLVLWSGWTTLVTFGKDRLASSVLVLSAFSLTFAANTAVGRLCLGENAGAAGRYVPYMLPLVIAAYLFVSLWPKFRRVRPAIIIAFFAIAFVKETVLARSALVEADHYARIKASFRECYLGTATLAACSAKWPIHPDPRATMMQEKLDYLRDHRLGLFREVAK